MLRLILCTFFFAGFCQAISPDDMAKMREKMMQVAETCVKETGAGPNDLQPLREKQPPNSKEGKCFMFCMHRIIGFQDESGKMNPPAIYNWVESLVPLDADYANKMKDVAKHCIETVNDSGDKCEAASDIYVCYTEGCKTAGIDMP
ncbi:hypothetical protein FQR65_LT00575 [Abscondita terminalis]|nr:hypothetical protein FQR65_LT00575 [Abscondita terminalis]